MSLSLKQLRVFLGHQALLLTSGVPLLRAVQVSCDLCPEKSWRNFVAQVEQSLAQGQSFSESLRATYPGIPPHLFSTLRLGEETGSLGLACRQVGKSLAEREQRSAEWRRMMVYPLFVLCVALASLWMLANFVLPTFESLYGQMGIRLPGWARTLFFAIRWGPWVVMGVAAVASLVFFVWSRRFRREADHLMVRIPILSTVLRQRAIREFMGDLSLLLMAGISLQNALALIPRESPRVIKPSLFQIRRKVVAGAAFSESIAAERLLPAWANEIVRVGEETGDMGSACQSIVAQLEEQDRHRTKTIMSMAEPILVLCTGLGVGFFVVMVVGPLFDLLTVAAW